MEAINWMEEVKKEKAISWKKRSAFYKLKASLKNL